MKHLLTIVTFIFAILPVLAQDGGYFLTHYSSPEQEINNVNFDIAQSQKGLIFIANRAGIIQFDGKNWEKIKSPSAIFSLEFDSNDQLYTGGVSGIGKIGRDSNNFPTYIGLGDSTIRNVFDIKIFRNRLYAINSETVFIYDLSTDELSKVPSKYGGELLKLSVIADDIYVNTSISGLKRVETGSLQPPANKQLEAIQPIFISSPNNMSEYIVGHGQNRISILKSGKFEELKIMSDYLQASNWIEGSWINDSLFAIATLKSGIIFINPRANKIEQILNYKNGLPDNEIFATSLDKHNGLWVAHSKGFTRISPEFPFRAYDRYPGLDGEMLTVQYFNDRLYVGTTLGVFYLDQVKEYNRKEVIEKQKVQVAPKAEESQERKGLFGFLKRNKSDEETTPQYKTRYITKVKRELETVRFEFKKIEGINSKVTHLSAANNQLYSGGLDGLFEIKDTTAFSISTSPVRAFHISSHYNKIFINTYNDRFQVYDLTSKNELNIFSGFNDWVSYMFEDHKNRIWFCSNNDLYWVTLSNDQIVNSDEYYIDNPYFYDTYGTSYNDSVYFVNESGVFVLSEGDNRLVKKQRESIDKYINDSNGAVWLLSNNTWNTLGADFSSSQINTLNIFTDIKHISYDADNLNFWVLTRKGNLYKLDSGQRLTKDLTSYDLFLKNIKSTDKIYLPDSDLKFEQQKSSLVFQFVQPEYSGVLNIEYSYMVEGLNDEWSEWSSGYDVIPIPYLPDGDYTLKMRSRNIITGIQEVKPIKFKIIPPYWKRPWFLAFEFCALGLLLFITVQLKKLGYKYRMLSRLLALLTLIIIIEFIQTIAENELGTESSPVFDFIIQITVAIIILPVEGLIRKYIFREKDVQILDFVKFKK